MPMIGGYLICRFIRFVRLLCFYYNFNIFFFYKKSGNFNKRANQVNEQSTKYEQCSK